MVSIIVPVYGVERYLRDCVDSILAQIYEDIQVILVDDGSPDNCGAICDEYAAKDSRVLSLHKPNGGVSNARNYALDYVQGEYLTFCDSDDAYKPDWIDRLVASMEIHKADVVVGEFLCVYPDGGKAPGVLHESGVFETDSQLLKAKYCFEKLMSEKNGWEVCTRLFRTDIIRREEIRFCETCGNFAEDLGFALSYSLFASRVVSINFDGYLYTIHGKSMMQKSASIPKLGCLQELYDFVEPVCRRAFSEKMAVVVLPWLYFQMIAGQFVPKVWSSGLPAEDLRKAAMNSVRDWEKLEAWLRAHMKGNKAWNPWYSGSYNVEVFCHMQFLLDGNWTKLRLQCRLIRLLRPIIDQLGSYAGNRQIKKLG